MPVVAAAGEFLAGALRARGQVIAMTGDGGNDAAALNEADVGIAMGRDGTAAAREAAETVLADDNIAAIAADMREGGTADDNLKKALIQFLPLSRGDALP